MGTQCMTANGISCAVTNSSEVLIRDTQSALEWMVNTQYETGCDRMAINREAIADRFFILGSGLAGDVLQKFVNYQVRLAIFGDFTPFLSKPLRDFIWESNRGSHVAFVASAEEAVAALCRV